MKTISLGIEERIVRLVEKHQMLEQVFAFGVDTDSAKRFRSANPRFPLALENRSDKSWSQSIVADGYHAVFTYRQWWLQIKQDHVDAAHNLGRKVHLFKTTHWYPGVVDL